MGKGYRACWTAAATCCNRAQTDIICRLPLCCCCYPLPWPTCRTGSTHCFIFTLDTRGCSVACQRCCLHHHSIHKHRHTHTYPDIQHSVNGDGHVIFCDGCLVADGDGQLLEAVHVRNAVNLAVEAHNTQEQRQDAEAEETHRTTSKEDQKSISSSNITSNRPLQ